MKNVSLCSLRKLFCVSYINEYFIVNWANRFSLYTFFFVNCEIRSFLMSLCAKAKFPFLSWQNIISTIQLHRCDYFDCWYKQRQKCGRKKARENKQKLKMRPPVSLRRQNALSYAYLINNYYDDDDDDCEVTCHQSDKHFSTHYLNITSKEEARKKANSSQIDVIDRWFKWL